MPEAPSETSVRTPQSPIRNPRLAWEYQALSATIRQTEIARVAVFLAGFTVWAALALAVAVLTATPLAVLLPLVVLAATFEAVFVLQAIAARTGRYLEVFHRDRWQHIAAELGRTPRALHVDALFLPPFLIAVIVNIAPLMVAGPVAVEWVFVGGAHALVVLRIVTARAALGRHRAVDLRRLNELKGDVVP